MKNTVRSIRGLAFAGVASLGLIAMTPAVADSEFDIGNGALTANADPDDAKKYLTIGMAAVVEKPIKPERLVAELSKALGPDDIVVADPGPVLEQLAPVVFQARVPRRSHRTSRVARTWGTTGRPWAR